MAPAPPSASTSASSFISLERCQDGSPVGGLRRTRARVQPPAVLTAKPRESDLPGKHSLECGVAAFPQSDKFEDDYQLMDDAVLGTGVSGMVREAVDRRTGEKVAVKSFKTKDIQPKNAQNLHREVDVHGSMRHPNIVRLRGVYESEQHVKLVLDKLHSELFTRLINHGRFEESAAAEVIVQVASAVCYMHSRGFMHRDIKPENLMYKDESCERIQVIDFGFATAFEKGSKLTQRCGTIQYVAPEVLTGKGYDEKADIWSLGAVAYTLLTQKALYSGDEKEVQRKNKLGEVDYSRTFKTVSKLAQDFVRTCLTVDSSKRPSAFDIFDAPWIKKNAPQAAHRQKRAHASLLAAPHVGGSPEIRLRLLRPKPEGGLPPKQQPEGGLPRTKLSGGVQRSFRTPIPKMPPSPPSTTTQPSSSSPSCLKTTTAPHRPSRWSRGESSSSGSPVSTTVCSGGHASSALGSDWTRQEACAKNVSTIEQKRRKLTADLRRCGHEPDCVSAVLETVCLQLMNLIEHARLTCLRRQ